MSFHNEASTTFKDFSLIESLIIEDEKFEKVSDPSEFTELGSWNKFSKIPNPKSFKPPATFIKPLSRSCKIRLPNIKVPKPSPISKLLPNPSTISNNQNQIQPFQPLQPFKLAQIISLKSSPSSFEAPAFRSRFRSNPIKPVQTQLKSRVKSPFPLSPGLSSPVDFPILQSQKPYRKISGIYPSFFYDKFFLKSRSNKYLNHPRSKSTLPERIQKKYNLGKYDEDCSGIHKFMKVQARARSLESEHKKPSLSPIYTRICKYHLDIN